MLINGKTLPEIKAEYEKAESVGLKCEQEIALVEALMATQWQPIETAPMDGKGFIATDGLWVGEVWHCEGHPFFVFAGCHPADVQHSSDAVGLAYWMPLPKPPIEAAIEAGKK